MLLCSTRNSQHHTFSNQLPVQTLPVYIYTALRSTERTRQLEPLPSDPAHCDGPPEFLHSSAGIVSGESKRSNIPASAERIRKVKRAAGEDDTVAVSSSGADTAEPADPVDPASGKDDNAMDVDDGDEAESETQVQEQTSEEGSDTEGGTSNKKSRPRYLPQLRGSRLDPFDCRHEPHNVINTLTYPQSYRSPSAGTHRTKSSRRIYIYIGSDWVCNGSH